MRILKLTILSVFTLLTFTMNGQENNDYSGFGGPMLRISSIDGNWIPAMGGFGGAIFKNKIAFGGFGLGYTSDVCLSNGYSADIGGGGMYFAYMLNEYLQIPLMIEWNEINIIDTENSNELESMSIIPGLEVNYSVKDFLKIGFNTSYRVSFIDDNEYFNSEQLNGLNFTLGFKFGAY